MNSNLLVQQNPFFIIFLDIDEVLIGDRSNPILADKIHTKVKKLFEEKKGPFNCGFTELEWRISASHFFSKNAKTNLENLIEKISRIGEIAIVVSSDWRLDGTVEDLKERMFFNCSFTKYIIDKTVDSYDRTSGHSSCGRSAEIDLWLRQNQEKLTIKSFVIFDDLDQGFSTHFPHQFVHVHSLLSKADSEKAYEILTTPNSSVSKIFEKEQLPIVRNNIENPFQSTQSKLLCASDVLSLFPNKIEHYSQEFFYKDSEEASIIFEVISERISAIYASFLTLSGHQTRDNDHLAFFDYPTDFPPEEDVNLFKAQVKNTINKQQFFANFSIKLSTDNIPEELLAQILRTSRISSRKYQFYKLFPSKISTTIFHSTKNKKIRISMTPSIA